MTQHIQAELPEVTNVLPELIIPPRPTALIPPGHVRTSLLQVRAAIGQAESLQGSHWSIVLQILEVGPQEPGMTTKERQDSFRTLQKFLAEEISDWRPASGPAPILEATLAALQSILQTPDLVTPFLASLLKRGSFSVGLLRLMTSGPKAAKFKDSDYLQTLLSVCISLPKLLEKKNPKKPLMFYEGGADSPGDGDI